MSEFLLELYSEEIPPRLQINARIQIKALFEKFLKEESLKYKLINSYSSPTRLTVLIKDIPEKIKVPEKEIKGPKVGVLEDILNSFIRAHNVTRKDVFEKENEKGKFYFIKTKPKEILSKIQSNIKSEGPKFLICKTVKGKGFKFSENDNKWHHSVMSKSQYEEAKKELDS